MKERPILFSAPMIRALLAGTKTQTRRLVKPQPEYQSIEWVGNMLGFKKRHGDGFWLWPNAKDQIVSECPHGQPGDRLWVREAHGFGGDAYSPDTYYRATNPDAPIQGRWRPSIHMHRTDSRITLVIAGVRVERLHDISEVDALAEGITSIRSLAWDREQFPVWRFEFDEACASGVKPPVGPKPTDVYRALWNSINGPSSWDLNPWVWCVEFRVVKP